MLYPMPDPVRLICLSYAQRAVDTSSQGCHLHDPETATSEPVHVYSTTLSPAATV